MAVSAEGCPGVEDDGTRIGSWCLSIRKNSKKVIREIVDKRPPSCGHESVAIINAGGKSPEILKSLGIAERISVCKNNDCTNGPTVWV